MPDQALNCWIMSKRAIMSSIELVIKAVICVPFAGQVKAAGSNGIAFIRGLEPTDKRFDHEVEKQG